jgi:serine/threonine protein kinase
MLTPGSVFAGYRIERTLGRGGMGDVYLARHPRLPRSDALKLMSEELSRSEVYRQRFSSEADLACMVQHDSVVRVYDRGEDDNRLWLAMEYIEGPDLAQILAAEGRLTVGRSVALLERIAAGLDAIHAHGLLHRDVKPANILVTRDVLGAERALLTDFGIAKSAADSLGLTGVGDIVATLHYAAPEQFELRSNELDRRVDVYALGCVLYEMLTGQVPLQGDSVAAFWAVMQSETPPPPSRIVAAIPPRLDAVVAKALSKRREDRYESAGELARAAHAAVENAPPTHVPPPAAQTTISAPSPAAGSGPFRLTLRRGDPRVVGGSHVFGPIETPRLAPQDAQRVGWLVNAANFFNLPVALTGGSAQSASLTVESPDRFHNVAWAGEPPPALAELVREVERLSGGQALPPQATAAPAPDGPTQGKAQQRKGKKRWFIAGGVAVVIAAAAVTTVLLVSGKKAVPGVPGGVSVAAGRGTVKVDWTASSGKVDHYVIFRDGKPVGAFVTGTSFTDTVPDTQRHSYTVQAVNAKGTTSALSAAAATAAEIRELNPAENALLAKLPTTLVDTSSCKPILAGVNPNLNIAIACNPKPGQTVTAPGKVPTVVNVYAAANATKLKAALSADAVAHGAKPGSCTGVPQRGTWNFTETPNVVNGQIICYRTTQSSLLWSYDAKLFYVKISTTASYQSLLTYWQDAPLHLP